MSDMEKEKISPRDVKLIKWYETKLENNPDKAIESTVKHFSLGKTQVRNIVKKYSKYPTPTEYKNQIRDKEAVSTVIADKIIDSQINEDYAGLITSPDLETIVKVMEEAGVDVQSLVSEILVYLYHNNIKHANEEALERLEKAIPLKKTLKQQILETEGEAKIMEAQKRIKLAESSIKEEELVQHYIKETGNVIADKETVKPEEIRNLHYDATKEEFYNDFMSLSSYIGDPNSDRGYINILKKKFGQKWAFKLAQAEEIKQETIKEQEEELKRIERENNARLVKIQEAESKRKHVELEKQLSSLSTEELIELFNHTKGEPDKAQST